MKLKQAILVAGALALAATAAGAEVYRWVDQDGKVHYGDRPASGAAQVTVKPPAEASEQPARQDGAAAAGDAPADAVAAREKQCDLARDRLATYENAGSLIEKDEFGREREVTGDSRIQLIVKAKRDVKEFCGEEPEHPNH